MPGDGHGDSVHRGCRGLSDEEKIARLNDRVNLSDYYPQAAGLENEAGCIQFTCIEVMT